MTLPKGVHTVKRGDKVYYYWRPTGARLPDPSSPDFLEAIERASKTGREESVKEGTFNALVRDYHRSSWYTDLKPETRSSYDRNIGIMSGFGLIKVSEIKRSSFLRIADTMNDRPGAKKQFLTVASVLMSFAVDRDYREHSPLTNLTAPKLGAHKRWTDEQVEYGINNFPEHYSRAVILAYFTGQREGDCVRMRWDQYDGNVIYVKQQKTGASVWIPVHSTLKRHLDAWRSSRVVAQTILTNAWGRPWLPRTLSSTFSRLILKHPTLSGLVFHGLRKAASAKLAEAGCTAFEIMSITGHVTLAEVERYTREAEQKKRASAAILKLETAAGKRLENSP